MEVINGWLELEDGMWFFGFIFGVKMIVFGEVGRYVNVIKMYGYVFMLILKIVYLNLDYVDFIFFFIG